MTSVRAHVTIRGHVQGVWYRGSMCEEAERLGASGWVRNRPDGSVEAEMEGPREMVEALIEWAGRGPRGARVTDVRVEWIAPHGERMEFAVRH